MYFYQPFIAITLGMNTYITIRATWGGGVFPEKFCRIYAELCNSKLMNPITYNDSQDK